MMQKRLRAIAVYNRYLNRGGEDEVFEAEARLLEQYGWRIICVTEHTKNVMELAEKIELAVNAFWSKKWYVRFENILQEKADVVHVHNFFPIMSPSIFYACQKAHIPVLQTLHNYRLLCPKATFYRNGRVCEDCMGKIAPWPGVLHGCYRGSRSQAAVVAGMLTVHRCLKTWQAAVDIYIALSDFSRKKFIQGGVPEEKIVVKPNFVHPDPGVRNARGDYALFVGRISGEKGVRTLLRAWENLRGIPLKVAGDGPLLEEITLFAQDHRLKTVDFLGRLARTEILALMKGARFLVFPSEWYEGFPMTIVEAFACGVPVVTSSLGAMAEIVERGRTGLHFTPGDAEDLAAKVEWAWTHSKELAEISLEARREFEQKYTAMRNYQMLLDIYELAIARATARGT